ncbi:MAG: flagellar motor switch protein FliN, partial [Lentisphaerae bacterium GWF2_52_8]
VSVSAELGRSVIKIRDLLNFSPGSVVELERLAGESIDLLVNGVLIGKGDVVVVNENFGLRITEIVCTEERIKKLSTK